MNALNAPLIPPSAENMPPVTTIVVGPTSTSMQYSALKTGMSLTLPLANGIVTMQNAESGVSLRVGERFFLDLGERGWKIRLDPTGIVIGAADAQGTGGSPRYFEAIKTGKTKLYATSDPPPPEASPPAHAPTLFLEIQITVMP